VTSRAGSDRADLAPGPPASGVAGQPAPDRDSWVAQVRVVRERLVREGVAAGHDEQSVTALVDRAAASYRDARVLGYVGILVERAVREQLSLPRGVVADRHSVSDPRS
jgi:hypothetical protein